MAKKFAKPGAIILDIEGTTTDRKFVSETLFPFVRKQLVKYLTETYETTETKEAIQRLRDSTKKDPEMPAISSTKGTKNTVIKSVNENIIWQMDRKHKSSELKQLEILVWVWGYDKGLIKGHVFDDVPQAMHNWKIKFGIKLCIFSSGMVIAQQLLFCCSTQGNLLPLIDQFFDNSIGNKTDSESFKSIANNIRVAITNILFITDNPIEAKASLDAGCRAVIIKRPGNKKIISENENIPIINSFSDIKF